MLVCGLWPAASAISQPALLTKTLSLEECPGHGPLLPLKGNVHELRLLYLEDYTWTWRTVLRLGGLSKKTSVTLRSRNMLVVDI